MSDAVFVLFAVLTSLLAGAIAALWALYRHARGADEATGRACEERDDLIEILADCPRCFPRYVATCERDASREEHAP